MRIADVENGNVRTRSLVAFVFIDTNENGRQSASTKRIHTHDDGVGLVEKEFEMRTSWAINACM